MRTARMASPAWLATLGFLLLAATLMILLPMSAHAEVAGSFYCAGGHAYGQLYDTGNGYCPNTMSYNNVFSFLVCHTEQLSANLMGSMYCGVIKQLEPAVTAAVTLAVLFSGIGFTFGFMQISARDYQILLLKISAVLAFATQSDMLIGIGYNFFVTGLRDGTAIAVSSLYTANGAPPANGIGVYQLLDGFLAQAFHFATDAIGQTWDPQHNPCKNALFAVMAIMAVAMPPVFYLGVMMIIRIAVTFVRAVFGYLYSLIGITFLLTLAPFFLSFYLFRQTKSFFDNWIKFLISFSLQMVIVFAFLSFVLSIRVDTITNSLTEVIMPVAEVNTTTALSFPWSYCTLCQFDVVDKVTGEILTNDADFLPKGKLQCRNPKTAINVLSSLGPTADTNANGSTADTDANAIARNNLLKFATHGLITLVVLAYIVENLLGMIPSLAQSLSAGGYSTMSIGMPGQGIVKNLEEELKAGLTIEQTKDGKKPTLEDRFKSAAEGMVSGRMGEDGHKHGGLVQSFQQFMIDPQRPNIGE